MSATMPKHQHEEIDLTSGSIEVVQIADLHVDRAYQRELSMDLVERIARDWDYAAAGPIVVSRRSNGDLYIVNGQHRTAAALRAGKQHVLAQVLSGLGPKTEARLRLQGNVKRTDTVLERFRAQLAAGDKDSLAIRDICEKFGTKINASPQKHEGINAVTTVESIYQIDNGMTLIRVFELITAIWGVPQGEVAGAKMLRGLTWLLHKHGDDLSRERLIERLKDTGYAVLMASSRLHQSSLGGSGWINVYRAAIDAYNKNLPESARIKWEQSGWSTALGATGRGTDTGWS